MFQHLHWLMLMQKYHQAQAHAGQAWVAHAFPRFDIHTDCVCLARYYVQTNSNLV